MFNFRFRSSTMNYQICFPCFLWNSWTTPKGMTLSSSVQESRIRSFELRITKKHCIRLSNNSYRYRMTSHSAVDVETCKNWIARSSPLAERIKMIESSECNWLQFSRLWNAIINYNFHNFRLINEHIVTATSARCFSIFPVARSCRCSTETSLQRCPPKQSLNKWIANDSGPAQVLGDDFRVPGINWNGARQMLHFTFFSDNTRTRQNCSRQRCVSLRWSWILLAVSTPK